MQKELTITIEQDVYDALHNVIGSANISNFIEDLVRPYVVADYLENAYRQMAATESDDKILEEWINGATSDVSYGYVSDET